MPHASANGLELYYETHGEGEPLLLIMGWGGNAAAWKPQLPGLAERFHTIVFDNRGVGRTTAPEGPYRTMEMAADAVALLDHLEIESAHVLGISLGGMIAQELAIAHPRRVDTLILGCTQAGGPLAPGIEHLRGDIDRFHELTEAGSPDLEWFADFLGHLWTEEAIAKATPELQDFVFSLIRYPPTRHGLLAQAEAVAAHNTHDRLSRILHRTLVITGDDDTLIDPRNSGIIAAELANADLLSFPGLKHAFHLEEPNLVNTVIIEFIEERGPFAPVRRGKGLRGRRVASEA